MKEGGYGGTIGHKQRRQSSGRRWRRFGAEAPVSGIPQADRGRDQLEHVTAVSLFLPVQPEVYEEEASENERDYREDFAFVGLGSPAVVADLFLRMGGGPFL